MRLLIAWVILAALAALSRWVAAPAVRGWGQAEIAAASPGEIPMVATVLTPFLGGFLEWMLPLLLIAAGVMLAFYWVGAKLKRRSLRSWPTPGPFDRAIAEPGGGFFP